MTTETNNAAAPTRKPEVVKALNHCLAETGCTKDQAVAIVIRALTEAGISIQDAFEAVLGPGSWQQLADESWHALQSS